MPKSKRSKLGEIPYYSYWIKSKLCRSLSFVDQGLEEDQGAQKCLDDRGFSYSEMFDLKLMLEMFRCNLALRNGNTVGCLRLVLCAMHI